MFPEYFDLLRAIAQPIRAAALPHSLAHVHNLLAALGSPQANFRAVVVTGSTGKGTTCLNIAHGLTATGLKVGLYTSPHLHLFRERIAILNPIPPASLSPESAANALVGAPAEDAPAPVLITQSDFITSARPVLEAQQSLPARYSTFETSTAIALYGFARQNIDIAVLEVGIGGRYDAVNAVANHLAVFTTIENEHVAMLGGSLESIAWHKAGIIQPSGTAISVNQSPAVAAVLEAEARAQNATLHFVPPPTEQDMHRPASPDLLTFNFQPLTSPHPQHSVLSNSLPARLERITVNGHPVIIDGGHTPAAARHVRQYIGDAPFRLIVGMLRDKDAAAYLAVFDSPGVEIVCTTAPGSRALAADELYAQYVPKTAKILRVPALNDALTLSNPHAQIITVIAGSFRMAAAAREAFGLLPLAELEESRLTRAIFEGTAYQDKLKDFGAGSQFTTHNKGSCRG